MLSVHYFYTIYPQQIYTITKIMYPWRVIFLSTIHSMKINKNILTLGAGIVPHQLKILIMYPNLFNRKVLLGSVCSHKLINLCLLTISLNDFKSTWLLPSHCLANNNSQSKIESFSGSYPCETLLVIFILCLPVKWIMTFSNDTDHRQNGRVNHHKLEHKQLNSSNV